MFLIQSKGNYNEVKLMKIQAINSYAQSNILNQPTFKDIEGADFSWQTKTPYQRDMEALDNVFFAELQNVEKNITNLKQRAKVLDKLWTQKEKAEIAIKERYGIIKKRNIIQKIFNLK